MSQEKNSNKKYKVGLKTPQKYLVTLGGLLFLTSFLLFIWSVYPVLKYELQYRLNKPEESALVVIEESPIKKNQDDDDAKETRIVVEDKNFGIVIPKLGINSTIIEDVDPSDPRVYNQALSMGVAHALGTAKPNETGNTFLFAHSSDTFLNASRYNAIFYLLNKLEANDLFYIAYNSELIEYRVTEMKVVNPKQIEYYHNRGGSGIEKTITLMTCWPPATTINRLIVIGVPTDSSSERDNR